MIGSIDWWLEQPWAMEPPRCEECKRPQGVATLSEDGKAGFRWGHWCGHCQNPQAHDVRRDVRWVIAEIRPLVHEVTADHSTEPEPDLVLWQRFGVVLNAAAMAEVASGFRQLARARETWAKAPGVWRLELRDDGQLWAPWCPINASWRPRSGDPLPYREGTLAESKRKRLCLSCEAPLSAGSKVWRPYKPGGTVRDAGWPADAHHHACVCDACARKVIAKGVQVGDEVVYGHLRVVGRETAG